MIKDKLWYVKRSKARASQNDTETFGMYNFNKDLICEFREREILEEICMQHNLIVLESEGE